MTEACATCGADDELLFTCRHCRRRFCERHELPHHACERFQSGREPAEAAESTDDHPVQDTPTETASPTERPTAPGSGQSTEAATTDEAPVRPMDSRRAVGVVSPSSDPQSLGEWLARQTYLTLLVKVGGLALLINVAFYGGVALTLYDPFGFL